jgi:hypothetical protein
VAKSHTISHVVMASRPISSRLLASACSNVRPDLSRYRKHRGINDFGAIVLDKCPLSTRVNLNGPNQLPKIILGIKFTDGIEVVRSQAQIAAA